MEVHATIDALRKGLATQRALGRSIGFVPTMGALHAGHRSLIDRSVTECDITVVSIFVNPLQFGAGEDLDRYPRTFDSDCATAEDAGVDYVFAPAVPEMYPTGRPDTSVRVAELSDTLEGLSRPGHFDGVATVVTKLFSIVGQCRAYFGEKDWQQLTIVRRLTADLSMPVDVIACPTVRDPDGLALSSRNAYLSPGEREAALALSRALGEAAALVDRGRRSPLDLIAAMTAVLEQEPLLRTEYATVVGSDLHVPQHVTTDSRFLVAARVGETHLIDNRGAFN